MSDTGKLALKYFGKNYNCAQAVLRAVLEEKGMYMDEFPYLAAGLGGGVSHQGNTCGAVTGAVLAIGMITSQSALDVQGHKNRTYSYGEKFISQFKEGFDSIICRELTGIDISNPKELERGRESGIFEERCTEFVRKAAVLVSEMFPDK
jgi:C_GCAxxG_C_C family probable redox protein